MGALTQTALDLGVNVLAHLQRKRHLGREEERADEQAHEVVHERRLAALPVVADELDDPAHDKEANAPAQPHRRALRRDPLADPQAQGQLHHHGQAKAQIEPQVEEGRQRRHDERRRQRQATHVERRARQQGGHGQHDHGDAHEMRGHVAVVLVVGRVLGQMVGQCFHVRLLVGVLDIDRRP